MVAGDAVNGSPVYPGSYREPEATSTVALQAIACGALLVIIPLDELPEAG
jgi:hypothetical protein